jgi:hypothetical protein
MGIHPPIRAAMEWPSLTRKKQVKRATKTPTAAFATAPNRLLRAGTKPARSVAVEPRTELSADSAAVGLIPAEVRMLCSLATAASRFWLISCCWLSTPATTSTVAAAATASTISVAAAAPAGRGRPRRANVSTSGENTMARSSAVTTARMNLRRPVIEAPPPLRRFLRQDRDLAERHAWLGALVIGIDTGEKPSGGAAPITPASPIVNQLTDKEMEMLRHLSALLSTEEIAHTMFVSVNTVKTHVRAFSASSPPHIATGPSGAPASWAGSPYTHR